MHPETKTHYIRKEMQLHVECIAPPYMLNALPLPQESSVRQGSPELSVPLVGRKNPGGITSLPPYCGSLLRRPYSNLTPQELQGSLGGPANGNLTVMEEEGLATTSIWILADRVHTCFVPSSNPYQGFCSSAEPGQRHTLTRELSEQQMCLIWILR